MRQYPLLLLITIGFLYNSAYSNSFYHAPTFLSYHRFEREKLFTLDATFSYGSCTQAHDNEKEKTNVLGIYNREQLHQVGKNIVNQDITVLNNLILDALWHVVPTNDNYGTLDFTGEFSSWNGKVELGYNITDSCFIRTQLPFYKVEIKNPTFTDTTPTTAVTVEWTTFMAHFDSILSNANLSREGYTKNGFGDAAVSLGWVRNIDDLGHLFALDTIIQLGVIAESADEQDTTKVFSLPYGNNKHPGFFFHFDTHIGFTPSFTCSFHTEQTVFLSRSCTRRIMTAAGQNGWIKLTRAPVKEEWGNKYALAGSATYNINDNCAFSMGYSYTHQNKHTLLPDDATTYSSTIINTDPMLNAWSMHTFHFLAEISGAHADNTYHPRVAFSYNRIIQSHNTFLNHTGSGTLGLAITTEF